MICCELCYANASNYEYILFLDCVRIEDLGVVLVCFAMV